MTLKEFAAKCGVTTARCDPIYGGTWAYHTDPHSRFCGYETEEDALKAWLKDEFGSKAGKAVQKLLEQSQ